MATEIVIPAQPVTPERLEYIKTIPKELMSAAVALVCSSEQYELNRALNYAQLSAGQAIIDLVAEVEGLTASRNYGRDIINDMTLEAYDFKDSILRELKEAWGQGEWLNIHNLIQSLEAEKKPGGAPLEGSSPAEPKKQYLLGGFTGAYAGNEQQIKDQQQAGSPAKEKGGQAA